ncbi:related to prolyl aminopeptidase [Cephalotrichum gorgonifer]|uniref:Related to prolyl aminopeptidase n=1 Tax=Cephalotrichum gorgonifer TaxID=2041049 RepID=A0AAE8MP67_9PEZI|nr:related to prolyl aminopeptidase [Cephalotrichum gorgonifer]
MADAQPIPPSPARLLSASSHTAPGKLIITEVSFDVPLNHDIPESTRIRLFGRIVTHREQPIVGDTLPGGGRPWLAYLEGGPGFGNRSPQDSPLVKENLHQSYRILFLDYRGTGLSTPVSATTIPGDSADDKAAYLSHFRQDSIVKDLEAVRLCLTKKDPPNLRSWSIWGQSFGGFVSLTYLSFFPDGLREVFLTGGLAPVNVRPEVVYEATFKKVVERNVAYYEKFPEDATAVHYIASHIKQQGGKIQLPGGGYLTVPRFLTLGISFGGHEGIHSVHALLNKMKLEIAQFGHFTRSTLTALEQDTTFDTDPIYAILHEAIYCYGPGVASDWAAFRVGSKLEPFYWLSADYKAPHRGSESAPLEPLYFSGEMIFPFHFDTYPELISLKEVAQKLALHDEWPRLYDEEQLARNEVSVFAASYVDDMYVDFDLARATAKKVRGIRVFETNALYHNAVRAKSGEVISALMRLRDDPIE